MFHPRIFLALLAATMLASSTRVHAQFYAPETEYHDISQRMFVVELARVLAWRANREAVTIHQITHKVSTTPDRQTEWQIQWLNAKTSAVHQATIKYPETLLAKGPEFFRSVLKQFQVLKWTPIPAADEAQLIQLYWEGAAQTGVSRCEGLTAAQKFIPVRHGILEKEMAPRLAGALAHTTLPSMAGATTIDVLLLSRSAVWLALAESAIKTPTGATDALWSPILYLAGREKLAAELWKKSAANFKGSHVPAQCWDFILNRPTTMEAFLFAANPANRQFAMPILWYYTRLHTLGRTLANAVPSIFGYRESTLGNFCDYAPNFYREAGVGGGRLLEGRWSAIARKQWIDLLVQWKGSTLDLREFPVELQEVKSQMDTAFTAETDQDESLRGFESAKPIIQLGYSFVSGPLIPTAAVTVKDLLLYGYEMTGMHLGARYIFINQMWGVPQYARPIFAQAVGDGDFTFFPFFQLRVGEGFANPYDYSRVQFVDYRATDLSLTNRLVFDKKDKKTDARLFSTRCWLRPEMVSPQCWALAHTGSNPLVPQLIARAHAEGGMLHDKFLLHYLTRWTHENQAEAYQPTREKLAAALPEPGGLHISVWWKDKLGPLDPFRKAQELEKLYWQNTATHGQVWAFENYIIGRAYKAAARFYHQIAEMDDDSVTFSNHLGPEGLMLGFLLNDEKLVRTALEASASASYADMTMHALHAMHRGDLRTLGRVADEAISRYESTAGTANSAARLWKSLIPLLPALKDPAHPEREKALTLFPASLTNSIAMQWEVIQQCNLPLADAIRFLGGTDTDPIRKAIIYYLQKDKEKFVALYDQHSSAGWFTSNRFVLLAYLRNELLDLPIPADQPDLKPDGYLSLIEAVTEYKKTLPQPGR